MPQALSIRISALRRSGAGAALSLFAQASWSATVSLRTLVAALRTFSGAGLGIAVISATPSATPEATSRIGGRTYGVGSKSSAKVPSLLPRERWGAVGRVTEEWALCQQLVTASASPVGAAALRCPTRQQGQRS